VVVAPDLDWVAALPPVVRLMTVGPEAPGALDLIRLLRGRDTVVAIGHTDASPAVVAEAVDAGATLFTHLWNGSGSVSARSPGPIGAALSDDRLAVSLIADLAHVDATSLAVAFSAKQDVVLVTDAVAWESPWATDQGIRMVDGAPQLSDGTLAGSSLRMDQAVRNGVEAVGLDLVEAVRASATSPARIMGAVDRGALAPGRRADVVVLDDELQVHQTWVGGQLGWS
jgi:N-acetylglucosamine-6-phosphate deacetylase